MNRCRRAPGAVVQKRCTPPSPAISRG
jgi:hypothetical protein